jgi:hypothetical protein
VALFTSVADPDPEPDLNKFAENFLVEIFLMKLCSKKYILGPKVEQQRFLKYLFMAFTLTKIVQIGSFIQARIRIRNTSIHKLKKTDS